MRQSELEKLRRAVADYMRSEGCSCCRDTDAHEKHTARLAELLKVPEHPHCPGYFDFSPFQTDAR